MNDILIGNIISIVVIIGLIGFSLIYSLYHQRKKTDDRSSIHKLEVSNENQDINGIQANDEENLMDDQELVAVITAAIYAYIGKETNVPKDGLIVRSIRRVNGRR